MGRGSSRELVRKILDSLKTGSKSITELTQECGTNWESAKEYLESLKKSGIVIEVEEGNKKLYSLACQLVTRTDTYFRLPLKQADETKINSLFSKITSEWVKQTGHKPNKTQMHKSFVKVNSKCNLNLPVGWYLYGKICVKHYDPLMEYDYTQFDDEEEIFSQVSTVVSEYSKEKTTLTLRLRQYEEEGNTLYKTRMTIPQLLDGNDLKDKADEINNAFYALMVNLPKIDDAQSKEIISEFAGLVNQLTRNAQAPKKIKVFVLSAFDSLWKLIAMYKFKEDLQAYYSKSELDSYIGIDIELEKQLLIDEISSLYELVQEEISKPDEVEKKIQSLKGSAKLLTEEEKKTVEKELETKSSSELFGALGLN